MIQKSAVLCVDDEPMVTSALRTLLEQHLNDIDIIEVANLAEEALEVADEFLTDDIELKLVVADYIMPQMRGDELLVQIHRQQPRAKKIMLTGQSDIAGVKRAINEAQLYRFIEKPWHNEDLLLTLHSALLAYNQESELALRNAELHRLNQELRELNEALETRIAARTHELALKNQELEILAVTDRLTQLFNRLKLDNELEQELSRARRYGVKFSVVLMDIDHFKRINDTYGHQAGDRILVEIAGILRATVRQTDKVGRWGGEEFLLICPETGIKGARRLAEHQRNAIAKHVFPTIKTCRASFGVAEYCSEDTSATLIMRVDAALYRAKAAGRNRVEIE